MVPTFGTQEYTNESCLEMSDYMFLHELPPSYRRAWTAKGKTPSTGSKPILQVPDSLPLGLNIVQNKTNWPEGPAIIQQGSTMYLSESNIQA